MRKVILMGMVLFVSCAQKIQANTEQKLTLPEFIRLATRNDTEFQSILIDELILAYRKDLNLPAKDIVLDIAAQYDLFLSQNRQEPDVSIALGKLFPMTGTEVEVGYSLTPSFSRSTESSNLSVTLTQPIAENAFGKSTQLQDQIIGIEIEVIRHQIIEAYEDYFAIIIMAYIDWYEAYERLKIGESSYQENLKLMENIKERQKSSIALPIDVNKIYLQVLAKEETLINLRDRYQSALNVIEKSIRHRSNVNLIPQTIHQYRQIDPDFERDFTRFKNQSRTALILDFLERKSSLEIDKNANALLPSIDLLLGYEVVGTGAEINDEDNLFFAGVSLEWPFGDQIDRAKYEVSKINQTKTQLSTMNTHQRLYTNIKNLSQQMDRERQLMAVALKKIDLSRSVLNDETENYSFGRVTINDYIQAVNSLDNNRFNKIEREARTVKLIIEWLRLTDQLVDKSQVGVYQKP